jgi:hypothetical protein
MSHIADLTESFRGDLQVGWLHPDHSYRQGSVPPGFVDRVKEFLNLSWACYDIFNWGACGGYHTCEFCKNAHATGSLGVLHEGKLYCAPTMIVHYVEQHHYLPPDEFIAAVLSGPLPDTPEFASAAAALHRERLRTLAQKMRAGTLTDAEQAEVHYFRSTGELLD